jgi:hypothetical protein
MAYEIRMCGGGYGTIYAPPAGARVVTPEPSVESSEGA